MAAVAAQDVSALHDLAFDLRPSVLDDAGLAPAMEHYAREFAGRHAIPVDVQVTGIHDRLSGAGRGDLLLCRHHAQSK